MYEISLHLFFFDSLYHRTSTLDFKLKVKEKEHVMCLFPKKVHVYIRLHDYRSLLTAYVV